MQISNAWSRPATSGSCNALEQAAASGRLKRGDLVLMAAVGGGFAWGAALLRW